MLKIQSCRDTNSYLSNQSSTSSAPPVSNIFPCGFKDLGFWINVLDLLLVVRGVGGFRGLRFSINVLEL